jgi:hypothetical protein
MIFEILYPNAHLIISIRQLGDRIIVGTYEQHRVRSFRTALLFIARQAARSCVKRAPAGMRINVSIIIRL